MLAVRQVLLIVACYVSISPSCAKSSRTLVSYNTGLTTRIPFKTQRAKYIQKELQSVQADVVCLQEYWYVNDVRALVINVRHVFPYSFSAVHSRITGTVQKFFSSPCSKLQVLVTLFHIWWNGCLNKGKEIDILLCAAKRARLMDLPQECITCIVMSEISKVYSECLGDFSGGMNVPALVLLSKTPLRNTKKVDLTPGVKQLLPRSYLYAEIDDVESVVCTHITANLGGTYYEPNLLSTFNSWKDQNLHDARTLVKHLHSKPSAIIMGDLNCGPPISKEGVYGDFTASFSQFLANTFVAPYADLVGKCTFCAENSLVPYRKSWIFDHILLRNVKAITAKRIFDKLIPGQNTPSSDHYGIQVTIETCNRTKV